MCDTYFVGILPSDELICACDIRAKVDEPETELVYHAVKLN